MPKISVIIPTYQHADTLPACLDSVFRQTFTDIEVIVINDGSTDATEEVLKPYLDKIKYKKIENAGAPVARNAGFALSQGAFVIFCDADIVMEPQMLEKLIATLHAHPSASYAYCGFRFGLGRFDALAFSAERLRKINFIHTTSLIRRADFSGFDESLKKFQDWDLWLTLLKNGKVGIGVPDTLFYVKPRREGISFWVPKLFYSPVFSALGITFKAVEHYRRAALVIAKKHGLELLNRVHDKHWLWAVFIGIFAVSAVAFRFPILGTVLGCIVVALVLIGSLNRLLVGVCAILAELIFGSVGGATLSLQLDGVDFPLRIALFLTVATVWLVRIAQGRVRLPPRSVTFGVIALLIIVAGGIGTGIRAGLPWNQVFFDANAYFALPLILFFASAVETETDQTILRIILRNGTVALTILTVTALYFFSHEFSNEVARVAYQWLRDTRIAEITALPNDLYRIFIQSQLLVIPSLFIALLRYSDAKNRHWWWGGFAVVTLLISLSRSFALGIVAGLVFAGAMWLKTKDIRALGRLIGRFGALLVLGVVAFLILLRVPIPDTRSQESFQAMRNSHIVTNREGATTSRANLLSALHTKIQSAPILGNGFGTTVTYMSADPRVMSATGGTYTTSAFEWGYHDLVVKLGLLGLLAYGFLLFAIYSELTKADPRERRWLVPAFVALLVTNVVSPYLNHPLGIGYLALLLAFASRKKEDPVLATEPIRVAKPTLAPPIGVAAFEE